MKLRKLLWILAMLPLCVNAEVVLKGNVVAADNEDVVFTFVVTPVDSVKKTVAGTIEGSVLRVALPFTGKADVKITSLGYENFQTSIVLEESKENDLGTVTLVKNAVALGEVTVTGKKINVRRDGPDYTIPNIQGTYLGNAGSLMDMLTWTPGVIVNQISESVSIAGAGAANIYINNRKIRDKSELNMLQSTMVSKIEIIRAPGAEYSASTAAVIKITTSKPLKDYLGVTLTNTSRISRKYGNTTRLNVNTKAGVMSGNFSLSYADNNSKKYDWESTEFLQEDGSVFRSDDSNTNISGSNEWNMFAGLNFDLGKKSVLGVQYSGHYRNGENNVMGLKSYNEKMKTIDKEILSNNTSNSKNHVASISYVWNRSKNSTLSLVADYSNNPVNSFKRSEERNLTEGGAYISNINTSKRYDIYTFNGNYSFSFSGKDKEKLGVEFYHVKADAGTSINDYMQGSVRKDTWWAMYYTFKRGWGKWNVELGLRYEHDRMKNVGYGGSSDMTKTYSDLLPTLRGSYKFNKDMQLTAIYRRVIDRPGYQQLDPTVYYRDSLNYSTGNPLLKPTYTDRYRLIFNWKAVSIGMQYWRYKDEVIDVLSQKEPNSNIYVSKPTNINKSDAWMLNVDYSLSVQKFNMSLGGGLVLPYMKYLYLDEMRKVNKLYGRLSGNFSYMFSPKFIAFMQAYCSTSGDSGITRNSSNTGINVGVQMSLLNNNLKVMVAGFDLLRRSMSPWHETRYGNMYQWHKNSYDTRTLYVNVSYTFNSLKTKFRNRGGSSKAYDRTN